MDKIYENGYKDIIYTLKNTINWNSDNSVIMERSNFKWKTAY